MSYPNFGCFAECLECELCEDVPPREPDLNFDESDFQDMFGDEGGVGDDFFDPPPERPDEWWENIDIPDVYPWIGFNDGGFSVGVGGKW